MAQPTIQASFNTGEWAPALNARVDMAKYNSAAALLENFFVDYRGGASTRPGTKYVLQAYKSATAVRLIPFQASFEVAYALEFGDFYIRFFKDGAPVLEAAVTGGTGASGDDFTIANTFSVGDWVYALNWGGMTNVNGRYFIVSAASAGSVTVTDLRGNAVVFTGVYTAGGQLQRVYTLASPYAAADLALVKYAQDVNVLYLCHPSYAPQVLTYISEASWTIQDIVFGATINTPTGGTVTTTLSGGTVNYGYIITAVDFNGQESVPTAPILLNNVQDLRSVAGTNTITWDSVSGAASYNVYKAEPSYTGPIQFGTPYGFIGNATGLALNDSNIAADQSQTPPVPRIPFGTGAAVAFVTLVDPGVYLGVEPAVFVTFAAAPPNGITATANVVWNAISLNLLTAGAGYSIGDILSFVAPAIAGVTVRVLTVGGGGEILTAEIANPGNQVGGTVPLSNNNNAGGGTGAGGVFYFSYGITSLQMTNNGAGYLVPPAITFTVGNSGGVSAQYTATLGPQNTSYPSVPSLFQQRLVLAAPTNATQTLYFSQPGSPYNFDISNPVQPDDSIVASLVSGKLNNIKSMISQSAGLLVLTDQASWLINGGGVGTAISPDAIVANAQSFNGANDVPPIVSNYDVLYVQSKGSIIRDSSYNFYANVFTGTDISVLSSHLFYGYTVLEWTWAEEPFKIVWAVRDDGALLSLTFLKEQEFIGWTHGWFGGDGLVKSVTSIVEETAAGQVVDAPYFVVQRTIDGDSVQYIERMAERIFPNGVVDAWCVDCGLQYNGAPATSFTGGEHLAGLTVTGLADGVVIPPFVMPASGAFTLATAASKVTVGLSFIAKLQTLAIDLGPPTVQGKVKKIPSVTVRVAETLGLEIGQDFDHLVAMKDLVRGNVSSALTGQQSQVVTDLVTGDAQTIIGPAYTVPGQYCIRLALPYPASILGVIPEITVGDTVK